MSEPLQEGYTLSERQRNFVIGRFSSTIPSTVKDTVLIMLLADHHDWSYEELEKHIEELTAAVEREYRIWRGIE